MNGIRIGKLGALACIIAAAGCGCKITHNIAYDLNPYIGRASSRDSMKPAEGKGEASVACVGARASETQLARVNDYHCVQPSMKERQMKVEQRSNPLPFVGTNMKIIHTLESPQAIGRYVEKACAAALAAKGVRENPQASKKVVIELEQFKYDEYVSKTLRKGIMNFVLKIESKDGSVAYQRRFNVEVTRERGQASATALIAAVAIAQVSPIAPNPEAWRAKEEQTVTADVFYDLFEKFEDEIAADADLIKALGN